MSWIKDVRCFIQIIETELKSCEDEDISVSEECQRLDSLTQALRVIETIVQLKRLLIIRQLGKLETKYYLRRATRCGKALK